MANTTGPLITNINNWIFQTRLMYQAVAKGNALLNLPTPTPSQAKLGALLAECLENVQTLTYLAVSANATLQSHLIAGTVDAIDDSDIDTALDSAIAAWVLALDKAP